jgi:ATP-dependent DNA helicase RecG
MKKIIDECTNAGLPAPAFDFDANRLMVEFKGKPIAASEKMAGKMTGKASEKRLKKIIELINANPEITKPEIASNVGVSLRSIERSIQELQKRNILKRVGATKKGHWEVNE